MLMLGLLYLFPLLNMTFQKKYQFLAIFYYLEKPIAILLLLKVIVKQNFV
jgi:hypothetical protein